MSELLSNVWLEIQGTNKKILICIHYREFSDLTSKGQMTINQQLDRINIFETQVEKATKEGVILMIGDMNINLDQWENSKYYLKKIAKEYQMMLGSHSLELINFGTTWRREHKDGKILSSAIDHAITNKLTLIKNYYKIDVNYSDHSLICVDLNLKIPKVQDGATTSRDYRKLRSNPRFFYQRIIESQLGKTCNHGGY